MKAEHITQFVVAAAADAFIVSFSFLLRNPPAGLQTMCRLQSTFLIITTKKNVKEFTITMRVLPYYFHTSIVSGTF